MARQFNALNLVVPMNATWEESWQLLQAASGPPVDLTGYTARMQLRTAVGASTVVMELSSTDGSLTVDGAQGAIALLVSPDDLTDEIVFTGKKVKYVFDVILERATPSPTYVIPLFSGTVTFLAGITTP